MCRFGLNLLSFPFEIGYQRGLFSGAPMLKQGKKEKRSLRTGYICMVFPKGKLMWKFPGTSPEPGDSLLANIKHSATFAFDRNPHLYHMEGLME